MYPEWSAFKILTGRPFGKRPLGRPRRRWKDNIRMDLEEIRINAGNWVDSAQDRDYWRALVNATLNLLKILSIFFSSILDPFHVVNSLLSHSRFYFVHPSISRSSLTSSFVILPG